jgi:CxxC-x17-CxxC domain-containing protein
MHKATCADCGNTCEVPFRPTGDKPIYCQSCFRKDGNAPAPKFGGRDSGRSSFDEKRMYEAKCDKCGNRCEVPFRPTGERPVFCRMCFGKDDAGTRPAVRVWDKNAPISTEQYDKLNLKLDKVLNILTADPSYKPYADMKPVKVVAEPVKPADEKPSAKGKKAKASAEEKPAKAEKTKKTEAKPKAKKK